jgi:mRNA-degrading endonuclease HigB of HigAB toxin-antitoxin module
LPVPELDRMHSDKIISLTESYINISSDDWNSLETSPEFKKNSLALNNAKQKNKKIMFIFSGEKQRHLDKN